MNRTELFVMEFYKTINVLDTSLLSIANISEKLNVNVHYWNHSSAVANFKEDCCMFINQRKTHSEQWQDFGHEMHHYFFDEISYDKLNESYGIYGETKADYFAYHFCVPTFMLMKLKGVSVYEVMSIFNVEYEFAMRRLDMYRSKLFERGGHIAMQKG